MTFLGNRREISTNPPPPLNVGVDVVVAYALHAITESRRVGSRFECVGGQPKKRERRRRKRAV